jgi:hypothetical protein
VRIEAFSFGSIRIDGVTYGKDVVIDRGKVKLLILPTAQAIVELQENPADTNAILHLTC